MTSKLPWYGCFLTLNNSFQQSDQQVQDPEADTTTETTENATGADGNDNTQMIDAEENKKEEVEEEEKKKLEEPAKPRANYEILLKMNNIANENRVLKKAKHSLAEKLQAEQENSKQLQSQIDELTEQLTDTNKNLDSMIERSEYLRKTNEKLASEKLFLVQENNLYKSQIQNFESFAEQPNGNELSGGMDKDNDKPSEQDKEEESEKTALEIEFENKQRVLKAEIDLIRNQLAAAGKESDSYKSEIEHLTSTNALLREQNEQFSGQINHLNRKYKSLAQEIERFSPKKPSLNSFQSNSMSTSPMARQDKSESAFNFALHVDKLSEQHLETEEDEESEQTLDNTHKSPNSSIQSLKQEPDKQKEQELLVALNTQLSSEKEKKYENEIETLKGHLSILAKTIET